MIKPKVGDKVKIKSNNTCTSLHHKVGYISYIADYIIADYMKAYDRYLIKFNDENSIYFYLDEFTNLTQEFNNKMDKYINE